MVRKDARGSGQLDGNLSEGVQVTSARSKETIAQKSDEEVVRVLRPTTWNQMKLVDSSDTVAALFIHSSAADRAFKVCSGKPFKVSLTLFIASLIFAVPYNQKKLTLPNSVWIAANVNFCFMFCCLWGMNNRYILIESLKQFDFWFVYGHGFSAGLLIMHGWSFHFPFAYCFYQFLLFNIGFLILANCDAVNPSHKAFAVKISIASAAGVLSLFLWRLNVGSEEYFKVIDYDISTLVSPIFQITVNNINAISRMVSVLIVFLCKYLFRLVFYPEDFVIIKASLRCSKVTVAELRTELSRVQKNHRLSQLPRLADVQKLEIAKASSSISRGLQDMTFSVKKVVKTKMTSTKKVKPILLRHSETSRIISTDQ